MRYTHPKQRSEQCGVALESIDLHDVKTRISELVARAQQGDGFIIARAGRPLVRVTAVDAPRPSEQSRIGFLAGHYIIPDHFDRLAEDKLAALFKRAP